MRAAWTLLAVSMIACGERDVGNEAPVAEAPAPPIATEQWQDEQAPVDLARERAIDLTGDGRAEVVAVTAQGARHDSLRIALTIRTASGDTLWRDTWSSMHYFKYDGLEGKADTTVARIVRAHVDSLLHESRFTTRGMPARLTQGAAAVAMHEAVRYHLAELDWRGGADLTPADPLPASAHDRIDAARVAPERVDVVIRELRELPVFWYYAGGEATYAIAWSDREHAFVRLHSCC
jgi:hypothetical protein